MSKYLTCAFHMPGVCTMICNVLQRFPTFCLVWTCTSTPSSQAKKAKKMKKKEKKEKKKEEKKEKKR